MAFSLIWLSGYVVTVVVAKVLYSRSKISSSTFDYFMTTGVFLWPFFLFFSLVEHGTNYIAEFFKNKDKVRVDAEAEIKQLKEENVFLTSELSEAQQKLSVLDGYRDRR